MEVLPNTSHQCSEKLQKFSGNHSSTGDISRDHGILKQTKNGRKTREMQRTGKKQQVSRRFKFITKTNVLENKVTKIPD